MSKKIKFGILGCGRIVHRGLIPGITESPEAELYAIASQRPGVAADVSQEHGISKAYDSYEAVLADPDVDAVYIPVTGEFHKQWTLAAAQAGKHILCEKPLGMTVAEAEEMVRACQDAGVVLQEAFMWRHHPRSKRAKELIEAGKIGDLRLICASFSFDIDHSDWRLDPNRGGGAIWDIGCYGVNASRFFAGAEPIDIHCRSQFHESGIDMTTQIALRFPGDVLANIDCSFEAPFRCHAEIIGTKGSITLPNAFLPAIEAKLLLRTDMEPEAVPEVITFGECNQYAEQVTDFCASIRAGALQAPAENGVANMKVLEQAITMAAQQS